MPEMRHQTRLQMPRVSLRRTLAFLALSLGALAGPALAGEYDCGPLTNHFGPFDYRTTPTERRLLVENAHFTPQVEQLRKGQSTDVIGLDINYTLSVFPNHPRALLSVMNLGLREKVAKPKGSGYTVDCWFDRAVRFRPDDATVRMLYGIHLMRSNRIKEGLEQLQLAEAGGGDDANLFYNMGLAYFSVNDYARALKYAHKAYALGFQLPGLRTKLQGVGKWSDAPPPAPAAPDVPAADAAAARAAAPTPANPSAEAVPAAPAPKP
ncbi:MAG: tetratricopeptide repeat protein [Zoogloea sp.]|uniref:tetratricopeptide repeat protein n=1 Tax=Zoogloea sp. TaxID=49181 RepID=UPI003F2CB45C